ncbi:MAG: hypothetical protein CR972_05195 [Candidatus Moraniibacteriota bacterium]|nr:MAG: hypothetical protein CR972_05195 [Candidatus Moranbacteria bacterium]
MDNYNAKDVNDDKTENLKKDFSIVMFVVIPLFLIALIILSAVALPVLILTYFTNLFGFYEVVAALAPLIDLTVLVIAIFPFLRWKQYINQRVDVILKNKIITILKIIVSIFIIILFVILYFLAYQWFIVG